MSRRAITIGIALVLAAFLGTAFNATVSASNGGGNGKGACVSRMMQQRPADVPANEWAEYVQQVCGIGRG